MASGPRDFDVDEAMARQDGETVGECTPVPGHSAQDHQEEKEPVTKQDQTSTSTISEGADELVGGLGVNMDISSSDDSDSSATRASLGRPFSRTHIRSRAPHTQWYIDDSESPIPKSSDSSKSDRDSDTPVSNSSDSSQSDGESGQSSDTHVKAGMQPSKVKEENKPATSGAPMREVEQARRGGTSLVTFSGSGETDRIWVAGEMDNAGLATGDAADPPPVAIAHGASDCCQRESNSTNSGTSSGDGDRLPAEGGQTATFVLGQARECDFSLSVSFGSGGAVSIGSTGGRDVTSQFVAAGDVIDPAQVTTANRPSENADYSACQFQTAQDAQARENTIGELQQDVSRLAKRLREVTTETEALGNQLEQVEHERDSSYQLLEQQDQLHRGRAEHCQNLLYQNHLLKEEIQLLKRQYQMRACYFWKILFFIFLLYLFIYFASSLNPD